MPTTEMIYSEFKTALAWVGLSLFELGAAQAAEREVKIAAIKQQREEMKASALAEYLKKEQEAADAAAAAAAQTTGKKGAPAKGSFHFLLFVCSRGCFWQ